MAEATGSGSESSGQGPWGVRFFPFAPDMDERIASWAAQERVRVVKVVPVYWEARRDG